MELQSVKGFSLCALKKLSFLFHLDAAVFPFCSQSAEYMGKPAPRTIPKAGGAQGAAPRAWLLQDTWALFRAAPWTCSLTFTSHFPAPGCYFFPLLPLFCLAPFSCNLFRAGTRCVCSYKGLRTMCPRWFVQVPSQQPQGFILLERNS